MTRMTCAAYQPKAYLDVNLKCAYDDGGNWDITVANYEYPDEQHP